MDLHIDFTKSTTTIFKHMIGFNDVWEPFDAAILVVPTANSSD